MGCVVMVRVWWNAIDVIVAFGVVQAVLYYRHCGLLVGFWWLEISWIMGLLEEQDGAMCSGPWLSFWSIEY